MPKYLCYAVAKGRTTGIFSNWAECEAQVKSFKGGAIYKGFESYDEAKKYLEGYNSVAKESPRPTSKNISVTQLHSLRGKVQSLSNGLQEFFERTNNELQDIKGTIDQILGVKKEPEGEKQPIHLQVKRKTELPGEGDVEGSSLKRIKISSNSQTNFIQNTRKSQFIVNDQGFVEVFTDGACSDNGFKGARGGIGVWWNHGHPSNISEPLKQTQRQTNNVAEIQAVIEAVKFAKSKEFKRLQVNTDSQFLINCMTQWMPKWKKNSWLTASKQPVKNKLELEELDRLLEGGIEVRWNHVRGHAGIEGNEQADELARLATNPNIHG